MDLYQAIRGRRSVRRFRADPIDEAILDRLLDAAQWAPSWAHTQCCQVVLATEPDVKQALQRCLSETNPAFRAMGDVPVVAAFCGQSGRAGFYKGNAATVRGDWLLFDVALAMQNFMLAAHAEGLGTVCVGLFDPHKAAKALRAPDGIEVVALTPLGYPDGDAKAPPRKARSEFSHRNTF